MVAAAPAAGPIGRAFAWLGAVAFMLSLVYFVYAYGVRFGQSTLPPAETPADVFRPALANLLLFTAFAVHHSIMARTGAKRWLARHLVPHLERTLYIWVASVLFVLTCVLWREIPGTLWTLTWPWNLLGRAAQVSGGWLTWRAARAIDIWDLAGIRQAHGHTSAPSLQVVGPYRWVRHPIYLGWVCLVFGTPEMTATRLAFACISTVYLMVAVIIEERSLVATFGDEYRTYQRRVRWRMVPGVY